MYYCYIYVYIIVIYIYICKSAMAAAQRSTDGGEVKHGEEGKRSMNDDQQWAMVDGDELEADWGDERLATEETMGVAVGETTADVVAGGQWGQFPTQSSWRRRRRRPIVAAKAEEEEEDERQRLKKRAWLEISKKMGDKMVKHLVNLAFK